MALRSIIVPRLEKRIGNYAVKMLGLLKQEVHVDTGALYDSLSFQKVGIGHYRVGVDDGKLIADPRNIGAINYAPYYYWGTKPHWIYPKKKGGRLSFIGSDGNWHYPKKVYHPGYKGDKFLDRAIERRPDI